MPSIKDVMTTEVVATTPSASALDAAKLMKEAETGCIVVVGGGGPVGILTERDFLRKILVGGLDPSKVLVKDVMSKPLITINPEASLREAARVMRQNGIRRLAVVENKKLVGIITCSDFAKPMIRKDLSDEMYNAMLRYPMPPPPGGTVG